MFSDYLNLFRILRWITYYYCGTIRINMLIKFLKKLPIALYYFFRLSVIVAILLELYQQQWLAALSTFGILILIWLPSYFKKQFKIQVPFEFELVGVAFVYLAVFLGEANGYYMRFWWWDVYLHFTSGLLLGIFGFMLVYILNHSKQVRLSMKAGFVALFAVMFAVTIGVCWEFIEYFIDSVFGLNMQKSGLHDTMWDLIMDFSGAFVISALGYLWMKRKFDFIIFDRTIGTFITKGRKD